MGGVGGAGADVPAQVGGNGAGREFVRVEAGDTSGGVLARGGVGEVVDAVAAVAAAAGLGASDEAGGAVVGDAQGAQAWGTGRSAVPAVTW